MKIGHACLALSLLAVSAAAQAAGMPRYDPDAYCRDVADLSGGSAMIFNGCIDMEQDAYNKLKDKWSSLPSRTRSYCDAVARTSHGSYAILDGCMQMESEAANSPKQFEF